LKADETAAVKDNTYRYAGYQYDHETGMYYLMARYYEPKHGVFLSLDPDPGDEDDIITQNGYTYANNNPVMLVDPDGHYVWALVGGATGGISSYKAARAKGARGWKLVGATAGGAALGAVGGVGLKAAKGWYNTARHWNRGTFKTSRSSLNYHHRKHVVKNNRSYSKKRYTDMSRAFYRSNKDRREPVVLSNKKKGYKIKNGAKGGYYLRNGKTVTFWNNKWRKRR
ncbi:RHS repeat-associated core domain-containing protein, partial [Shouchella miscanthi]|nr:RHS repeat-associated core domain-containing protein [Shouchella miscanthi]